MSNDLVFDLDASSQLNIIQENLSMKSAQDALQNGKIMGFIIIPEHFKRDILLNKRPTIYLGADASYFLVYGGIIKGALKTILTLNEKIKTTHHLIEDSILVEAVKKSRSFVLSTQSLFNHQSSYLQYVVPAVFILILQQTMLIGMGIIGGGENERRQSTNKNHLNEARLFYKILARLLIFISVFFIHILFYFGFVFEFYAVTHLADILDLLNFSLAFLVATASFGLFFGSLMQSREMATPLVLFSSLPLVFAAGFVWPVESLPALVQFLSLFVPSTPAIEGFLHLNQMGASFDGVMLQYLLLWLQAALYLSLSVLVLRYQKGKANV